MPKLWRASQLGEVIAHDLSELIQQHMKDPRIGFASITTVKVSNDLRHAKVFVSVMGDAAAQKETLTGLVHASGFLRHELAQRLSIRYTPQLSFQLDESIAHGAHVLNLINQVTASPSAAVTEVSKDPDASD